MYALLVSDIVLTVANTIAFINMRRIKAIIIEIQGIRNVVTTEQLYH